MVMFSYLVPLFLLYGRNRICFSIATCANNVAMVQIAFNVWRRLIYTFYNVVESIGNFPCAREFALQ